MARTKAVESLLEKLSASSIATIHIPEVRSADDETLALAAAFTVVDDLESYSVIQNVAASVGIDLGFA